MNITMTRRDTLAGAIALLCELGAAEVQARAGVADRASGPKLEKGPGDQPQAASLSETPLEAKAECLAGDGTGRASAAQTAQGKAQSSASSEAQAKAQSETDLVFKHDLPNLTMDDWEVTVSTVDYAPGRVGKVHHHAGFVLAYVLEGNVVTKISEQEERTYRPGEMFYEPPGSTHEVSRNASETKPAKLLAMIFAKKGVPLTMPGPA
jgi:quercetin dioxygenase-like cupin family protein